MISKEETYEQPIASKPNGKRSNKTHSEIASCALNSLLVDALKAQSVVWDDGAVQRPIGTVNYRQKVTKMDKKSNGTWCEDYQSYEYLTTDTNKSDGIPPLFRLRKPNQINSNKSGCDARGENASSPQTIQGFNLMAKKIFTKNNNKIEINKENVGQLPNYSHQTTKMTTTPHGKRVPRLRGLGFGASDMGSSFNKLAAQTSLLASTNDSGQRRMSRNIIITTNSNANDLYDSTEFKGWPTRPEIDNRSAVKETRKKVFTTKYQRDRNSQNHRTRLLKTINNRIQTTGGQTERQSHKGNQSTEVVDTTVVAGKDSTPKLLKQLLQASNIHPERSLFGRNIPQLQKSYPYNRYDMHQLHSFYNTLLRSCNGDVNKFDHCFEVMLCMNSISIKPEVLHENLAELYSGPLTFNKFMQVYYRLEQILFKQGIIDYMDILFESCFKPCITYEETVKSFQRSCNETEATNLANLVYKKLRRDIESTLSMHDFYELCYKDNQFCQTICSIYGKELKVNDKDGQKK